MCCASSAEARARLKPVPDRARGAGGTAGSFHFIRSVSPLTAIVYTHTSDQELWASVRRLNC